MIRLLLLLASLVGVASATSDLPPLYDAWTDGSAIDHSSDEANRVRYYFSRSTALPERRDTRDADLPHATPSRPFIRSGSSSSSPQPKTAIPKLAPKCPGCVPRLRLRRGLLCRDDSRVAAAGLFSKAVSSSSDRKTTPSSKRCARRSRTTSSTSSGTSPSTL